MMKKNYYLLGTLFLATFAYSQVGINTDTPKTTLDVTPKKNGTALDLTQAHGLQAPRLTRTELANVSGAVLASSKYGTDQKGALVYITDITGTDIGGTSTQRLKITAVGYYYFDGSIWQKVNSETVTTTEPWRVLGSAAESSSNTENIYQSGRVLVGFPSSHTSSEAGVSNVSVLGQKFNVADNFGVSRQGSAANMVMFRAEGTNWATPGDTTVDAVLGNFLYEGYSDAKRAGNTNYGTGRVGVAQVRATATSNFTTNIDASGKLSFFTKNVGEASLLEKMTILGNGNVGIGILNPTQKLDVNGTAKATRFTNGSAALDATTVNFGLFGQTSTKLRIANAGAMAFHTDGAVANNFNGTRSAMYIATDRNIGIGTETPAGQVHVVGNNAEQADIILANHSDTNAPRISLNRSRGVNANGDFSSRTPVQTGDILGRIDFQGLSVSGTGFQRTASIVALAQEVDGSNNVKSQLGFYTGVSVVAQTEKLRLNPASSTNGSGVVLQQLNLNSTSALDVKPLFINGSGEIVTKGNSSNSSKTIDTDYTVEANDNILTVTADLTLTFPSSGFYVGQIIYVTIGSTSRTVTTSGVHRIATHLTNADKTTFTGATVIRQYMFVGGGIWAVM